MATDIAFALAVLGLLGKRVPLGMRIFLTALAVVDDIGGIIIIALFYSGDIAYQPLLISLALLALLYVGGKMRINNNLFYYVVGFFVWVLFLESGIHPTIAGVLVAFTVPARPKINLDDFTCDMTGYLNMLDYTEVRQSKKAAVLTPTQIQVLNNIHSLADKTISPLQSIADKLHPLVNYLILPLFAFVNAGVTVRGYPALASLVNVPVGCPCRSVYRKDTGNFLFHLSFCPYEHRLFTDRNDPHEFVRRVDAGRYWIYGSPVYRQPLICRHGRCRYRLAEPGKTGCLCRLIHLRPLRLPGFEEGAAERVVGNLFTYCSAHQTVRK